MYRRSWCISQFIHRNSMLHRELTYWSACCIHTFNTLSSGKWNNFSHFYKHKRFLVTVRQSRCLFSWRKDKVLQTNARSDVYRTVHDSSRLLLSCFLGPWVQGLVSQRRISGTCIYLAEGKFEPGDNVDKSGQYDVDLGLEQDEELDETDTDVSDVHEQEFENLRHDLSIPGVGHHLYVIQPRVKSGMLQRQSSRTTLELQLAEACGLVEALPHWKVVKREIVVCKQPGSKQVFSSGILKDLTAEIRELKTMTAVFISIDILTGSQVAFLQNLWGVHIFDRYTLVLQIFKERAQTHEAKLQVALAEVPYIRARLHQIHEGKHDRQLGGASAVGGAGEKFFQRRQYILHEREKKICKALEKVKKQRNIVRQNRQKKKLPTVAVVGYTNCGKTSLIKALTGDQSMEPKDQMFATLDVTAHGCKLPTDMTVVFIDTVGFISDIPATLIDAFSATLEDAVLADTVVHVRDISHPDTEAQKENVLTTLQGILTAKQIDTMIEVCNKVDLVDRSQLETGHLYISATLGIGLHVLLDRLERSLIQNANLLEKTIRIPMNGPHLSWLYKEATVRGVDADEGGNKLTVNAVFTESAYARFKARFPTQRRTVHQNEDV